MCSKNHKQYNHNHCKCSDNYDSYEDYWYNDYWYNKHPRYKCFKVCYYRRRNNCC